MAGHTSKLAHFLCPPKYIMMHSDILNIHFRLFPSLHSDLEHGKVVFCDFVSIFSLNYQVLIIFLNSINKSYSILKHNHNKLGFT
jgi:hypothetical protein